MMIFNIERLKSYNLPKWWISDFNLKGVEWKVEPFLYRHHSTLLRDDRFLYKFCKLQKIPKDIIRKLSFDSQAKREFRGAELLNSIEITTPKPIFYAYTLSPFERFESLYVMEFIEDAITVDIALSDSNSSESFKFKVLELLVRDLLKMRSLIFM